MRSGCLLVLQIVEAQLGLEREAASRSPGGVEPRHHVPVEPESELIGQEQQTQGIAKPPVELAVHAREDDGFPHAEIELVGNANAHPMGKEVAMDPVAE